MSSYNEDGTVKNYGVYEYDSDGNCVKESSYSGDETLSWVIEYEDSNLVKSSFYNEDGTVKSYVVYGYDSDGNRVKESRYNEDGTMNGYTLSEYDSAGNCVKESDYSGDGTLTEYTVYEYDEQGKEIKRSYYDGQGVLKWYSRPHLQRGRLICGFHPLRFGRLAAIVGKCCEYGNSALERKRDS